jgi:hypothetical protein
MSPLFGRTVVPFPDTASPADWTNPDAHLQFARITRRHLSKFREQDPIAASLRRTRLVITSSGEPKAATDTAVARKFESTRGGGHVLNARAAAVEYGDLIMARPPAAAAGDEISEFGVNLIGRHPPRPNGVVQVAHGRALRQDVRDNGRLRH